MKTPKVEPFWGLVLGFSLAPLACALNSGLFHLFFQGISPRFSLNFLQTAIWTMVLTLPLGFMTTKLLEIWEKRQFGLARGLGGFCGLFAVAFWSWIWNSSSDGRILDWGALSIPFLWSMLIPIAAFFARPPKN